jgi:hypothetical protein
MSERNKLYGLSPLLGFSIIGKSLRLPSANSNVKEFNLLELATLTCRYGVGLSRQVPDSPQRRDYQMSLAAPGFMCHVALAVSADSPDTIQKILIRSDEGFVASLEEFTNVDLLELSRPNMKDQAYALEFGKEIDFERLALIGANFVAAVNARIEN